MLGISTWTNSGNTYANKSNRDQVLFVSLCMYARSCAARSFVAGSIVLGYETIGGHFRELLCSDVTSNVM
jgi:hypothetical protein